MKRLALTLLLLSALLVNMAAPALAAGDAKADRLNIAIASQEGALNPYGYSSETGYNLTHLIYDSLFILDAELNIVPWLVEEYSYDEATLTYTFKIHDGVYFHDGEKLTAEDVKFTYDYLLEHPKSRFSQPSEVIAEITVVDELTVTMTLSAEAPDFLSKPLGEMGILPEHIWSQIDDPDTCLDTVGSGMYRVTEVADREYYILEKNESYWNGEVAVDMLYIPIISDASTRQTGLLTGELDASSSQLSAEVISSFTSSGNFNIYQGAGFPSTMLYFNCDRAPFDNVEFRKALSLAIDRQDIIDTIMLGYATPGTNSHVHPAMTYYNDAVEEPGFDLAAANEILDGLGYTDTNGDGIREMDGKELNFTILAYANNTARTRIAELIKDWYADIGIGITVSAMDMDTVDNIVWPGYMSAHDLDYDMVMWGWGASTMNAAYVNRMWNSDLSVGTSNVGAFASEAVDELVEAIDVEGDAQTREDLLKELQAQLVEEYPAYVFYYADLVFATSQKYDGWVFQNGAGILNVFSFLASDEEVSSSGGQTTTPPAGADDAGDTADSGAQEEAGHHETNLLAVLLPLAAIVLIVAVILVKNRKKK